jgi:DNA mismatch repair ATPase MutS
LTGSPQPVYLSEVSEEGATPYTDYLLEELTPVVLMFSGDYFAAIGVTAEAAAALNEATRVMHEATRTINSAGATPAAAQRSVADALARADALGRQAEDLRATWKKTAVAFEVAFQKGVAISEQATEEDLADAREAAHELFDDGNYRLTVSRTSGDGVAIARIVVLTGMTFADAASAQKSIEDGVPAELVSGVSLEEAAEEKRVLERLGWSVSIAEGPPPDT